MPDETLAEPPAPWSFHRLVFASDDLHCGLWRDEDDDAGLAAAQRALLDHLRAQLPAGGGPVLVIGADLGAPALALAAGGHAVTALCPNTDLAAYAARRAADAGTGVRFAAGGLADAAAPEPGYAAVVLLECLDRLGPLAAALARALLAPGGRLLIAGAVSPVAARELAIALAEAGFVVLKHERLGERVRRTSALALAAIAARQDELAAACAGDAGRERQLAAWLDGWRERCAGLAGGRLGYEVVVARREDFFVRGYREGDEAQILALFASSFHVPRSVERWRWEYRENPHGNLAISEAFAADGRLVAHYAAYPVRFHDEVAGAPRARLAYQVGDTMTAPEVRHVGRGPTSLLARTVRHFYASLCEGRVAFNYGFNTGNIQRFSLSFVGARRFEPVPFRVLDPAARPLPRPSHLSRLAGWRVERVTHFDARWDELFARVRGSYRLLVERDARYLEWRYARCPDPRYSLYAVFRRRRLIGWSVFRQKGERLLWGDALFDPRHPGAVARLLAAVLAAPEHRGARTVAAWVSRHPAWWPALLDRLGFESRPEPEGLGVVFVPFEHDPEQDFRDHLYYTMGDGDLF
jgi:GNAT acetyltransferase-like protein